MVKINDSLTFENRTSNPSTPIEGQLYYNSTDKVLKIYNGTDWVSTGLSDDGIIFEDNTKQAYAGGSTTATTFSIPSSVSSLIKNDIDIIIVYSNDSINFLNSKLGGSVSNIGWNTTYRISKIYSAVETDLVATTTYLTVATANTSSATFELEYDATRFSVSYTPTTDEKTNGFDIKFYSFPGNSQGGGDSQKSYTETSNAILSAFEIRYKDT